MGNLTKMGNLAKMVLVLHITSLVVGSGHCWGQLEAATGGGPSHALAGVHNGSSEQLTLIQNVSFYEQDTLVL